MFQLLWKFTSLLLGILRNKFQGILKKKSLGQNFFTCLPAIADREAFVVLDKPGELLSRRVGAESPGALLPAGTKGGPPVIIPWGGGGGEGHREWLFAQWKCLFSLQDSLGQTCPAGLAAESQPASQTQARWVSRLCVLNYFVVYSIAIKLFVCSCPDIS